RDELRRADDVGGRHEIERADFVGLAPASPVLQALGRRVHVLAREPAVSLFYGVLDFRYACRHGWPPLISELNIDAALRPHDQRGYYSNYAAVKPARAPGRPPASADARFSAIFRAIFLTLFS